MQFQHLAFTVLVLVLFGAVVWAGFVRVPEAVVPTEQNSQSIPDSVPLDTYYINASPELIRVAINPGSEIESPLTITGEARGFWFFEASFPVALVDWDGLIIAEGVAQAENEWMTENFVPFSVTLTFSKPSYSNRGALILKRDNPSGLPENDAAVEIPIRFK